jgi:hypothetical protein
VQVVPTSTTPPARLDKLPLYGMGISAGGAFMLKLPRYLKVRWWCWRVAVRCGVR